MFIQPAWSLGPDITQRRDSSCNRVLPTKSGRRQTVLRGRVVFRHADCHAEARRFSNVSVCQHAGDHLKNMARSPKDSRFTLANPRGIEPPSTVVPARKPHRLRSLPDELGLTVQEAIAIYAGRSFRLSWSISSEDARGGRGGKSREKLCIHLPGGGHISIDGPGTSSCQPFSTH
jgi:hypothetical protein